MRTRIQIITVIFLLAYLLTVTITEVSFTGFWTDIVFSILLSSFAFWLVSKNKTHKRWLTIVLRGVTTLSLFVVLVSLGFISLFGRDVFKVRNFYSSTIDGRHFNAYFKPVGAYAGGFGNFWITENLKYLPIVEVQKYYDATADHDFTEDYFDGQLINNKEIVTTYIREEIISKGK